MDLFLFLDETEIYNLMRSKISVFKLPQEWTIFSLLHGGFFLKKKSFLLMCNLFAVGGSSKY